MNAAIRWLKRGFAFLVMLVGFFFVWQSARHSRRQAARAQEAEDLGKRKDAALGRAAVARARAKTENAKANEALIKAHTVVKKLKENKDDDLADRVTRFNERMHIDRRMRDD